MGRRKNRVHIIGIVLMIFSISTFIACSSPTTIENINKLENEGSFQLYEQVDKSNMTETEKKLSTDLLYLVGANESQSSSQPVINSESFRSSNFIPADSAKGMNDDLVHVYVYFNEGNNIDIIQPFVNEITGRDEENSVAAACVSVNKLEELASMEEVRNIRTVVPPVVNVGSVTTQGDIVHGTASVRSNYGQDGTGIKIGVISDGVQYLPNSQNAGELPADVTVLSDEVGGNEGTAMLEIIHDMAPGAKLYFHDLGADGSYMSFNAAIDDLVGAGCNIIVDDVGRFDQPYFQDGPVATHIEKKIKENNIMYMSSAGNFGDKHYQGTYVNDGNNNHAITIPVYLEYSDYMIVDLQWNDQFGSSSNDYDLQIYDSYGRLIRDPSYYEGGIDTQNGNDYPSERIIFINPWFADNFKVVIENYKGEADPRILEMMIRTSGRIDSPALTATDSIFGHQAASEVITVGAIPFNNTNTIEDFSSQGPVTIAYPVPSQRQKPDICGVDGVSTAAADFNPFYGTSAAAPHIAAVAALIWSSNPSMTAAEVRNILLSNAVDDRGIVGYDTVYGYGIANSSKYFKNQAVTVDKTALIAAITAANAKVGAAIPGTDINQYPQTAIDAFKAVIAAAQAVVDNPAATQTEVNQAVTNLATAEAAFDAAKIITVDKAPLITTIATANSKVGAAVPGIEVGQYPQIAIDIFKAAIAAAQTVVDNPAATQAEVNQAVTNLATAEAAFDSTIVTTVDKNVLVAAIAAANTKVGPAVAGTEDGQYPQTAIDVFKAAIAAAQTVVDNPAATQAEVNQAVTNLATAEAAFDAAKVSTALPVITSFSGKDITTTSITLVWETSTETTKVQIVRNGIILADLSGTTSYVDSNLASDTTYDYTLIPYNMNGLAGEAVSISLKTDSSSSGGGGGGGSSGGSSSKKSSSGGGGGGGAGSAENFENVAVKDVAREYLRMNTNSTYEFSREGNPIRSVSFYSLKNSGEITSTIEVLNNRSKLVNSTPEEAIYKYVNIWVGKAGFATASNMKDAQVKFKVSSSWLEETDVNPEDVRLQVYSGNTWKVLPTTIDSTTASDAIFEARTTAFGPFAITAQKALSSPIANNAEDVSTTGTQPEQTPGFGFGIAVLMIGVLAAGYVYLKKQH